MSKFTDLDLEHKAQLMLNMRVQSLMAQFISHTQDMGVHEALEVFYSKAAGEVFQLSESAISAYMAELDQQLENYVQAEASGIIRMPLD